ncbi:hypothetical protein JOC78_001657 [Bacillus ectoiniformans]|uniref:DUF3231 family protein n=1 Tax=Bacillus ectoiniformans TaxID=1494429 RepID=UPI00195795DA|nr:DUF3231 family protein [Bacillus ectoiniformans]MBM7648711.1 hypothetical protein [Bacillus ectoiniformans]
MGILSGNQSNEPMHYGEVFAVWSADLSAKALTACYQTMLNHAGDEDLRRLVEEAIQLGKKESQAYEQILKENGVGLAPTPPDRPQANIEDIPAGARFQDPEIAAAISRDIAAGMTMASQAASQCTREDIAAVFLQSHQQQAALGGQFLKLNKEKGWIVVPPLNRELVEA